MGERYSCPLASAPAAAIYSNGPSESGGLDITGSIQADDFELILPATLASIRFWAFHDPGAYQGSIVWQIYGDVANQPGAVLHSGTAVPTIVIDGNSGTFRPRLRLDFDVSPIDLAAGRYWLGLHNGPLTTTAGLPFLWETALRRDLLAVADQAPFGVGGWSSPNSLDRAFALFDPSGPPPNIPEPSSILLMGAGLLLVAARFRRLRELRGPVISPPVQ